MMKTEQHTPGASAVLEEPFQARVQPWMMACFGAAIAADGAERNHRFLEESLELVQACGCTASEAHQLVEYVFGRPVGERAQEVGGVMVTLAALCLAQDLDMHAAGEVELARIWTKVEAIRAKQAAKPKHSPLPAAAHHVVADERQAFEKLAKQHDWDLAQAHSDGVTRWLSPMTRDLYLAFLEGRAALAAAPVQAQEPVALLTLGGIDGDEYGDNDLELVSSKAVEKLQAQLVRGQNPVVLELFAHSAPVQPVAVPQVEVLLAALNNIAEACNCCGDRSDLAVMAQEALDEYADAAPAAQGDSTQAEKDVLAERRRQIDVEGRTTESDDRHIDCQLARAAATYALCTEPGQLKLQGITVWPWGPHWWKFTDYRRNLVKSGALIVAEIERVDRAAIAAKAAS